MVALRGRARNFETLTAFVFNQHSVLSYGNMDGRRARSERTRELILTACISMIARDGMAATTQRRVATAAETSLASVTYHFPSLDDLLVAAMTEASFRTVGRISAQKAAVESGASTIVDAVTALLETELSDPESPVAVMFEANLAARRRPALRPGLDRMQEEMETLLSGHVSDPETARAMARSLQGVGLWVLSRDGEMDLDAVHATLLRTAQAFGLTPAAHTSPCAEP